MEVGDMLHCLHDSLRGMFSPCNANLVYCTVKNKCSLPERDHTDYPPPSDQIEWVGFTLEWEDKADAIVGDNAVLGRDLWGRRYNLWQWGSIGQSLALGVSFFFGVGGGRGGAVRSLGI